MVRVLVTGSQGQLGQELKQLSKTTKLFFYFTTSKEFNITNLQHIKYWFEHVRPKVLINCAAYTAVDRAEIEYSRAYEINAIAPSYLSSFCKEYDTLFVHISTDYVFDGTKKAPYVETDTTNPLNIYGKTKLEGEKSIIASDCNYIILRTSWLYSSYGQNFVKTILHKAKQTESLRVVNDQYGNPTYARDLAEAIISIIQAKAFEPLRDLLHFSNIGNITWYDFALMIIRRAAMQTSIEPITSEMYSTLAKRPFYSVLDCSKIHALYGISLKEWHKSLDLCLKEIL